MMRRYQAPAKVNLSLHVRPPTDDGYHPLESMVQTLDWSDLLEVEAAEEWRLVTENADLDGESNLVTRAFETMGVTRVSVRLVKRLPVEAGLGGGSSDAAAALIAAADFGGVGDDVAVHAADLGADVPLFLTGGTQMMTGRGEILEPLRPLRGFAIGVVVPDLRVSTTEVYRRWDAMEGPIGETPPNAALPPELRDAMPLRNDLLPAAIEVEPALGDFLADVRQIWGRPVLLTGSGPSCFGFFGSAEEAGEAVRTIRGTREAAGVDLRDHGVSGTPGSEYLDGGVPV